MVGSISRTRMFAAFCVVAAVAAMLTVLPATKASAGVSSTGKVVKVLDGDTVRVKYPSGKLQDIRFLGVDTPEKAGCGYTRAGDFVRSLILNKTVTLKADFNTGVDSLGRIHRRILFTKRDGTVVDVTAEVLRRGLGLWSPDPRQPTAELKYHKLSESAAQNGYGMFTWDRCGASPAARALPKTIQFDVQWKDDANGGEHARITNNSPVSIDFDNWGIRAGGIRSYKVPSGRAVNPGETLRVYAGEGRNSADGLKRFLQRDGMGRLWADLDIYNPAADGEGGYLLDPQGDVRAYQIYGCLRCGEQGAASALSFPDQLQQTAAPDKDEENLDKEFVVLKNTSDAPVFVGRLLFDIGPFTLELPPGLSLAKDESIKVVSGERFRNAGAEGPIADTDAAGNKQLVYYLNSRKKTDPGAYFQLYYTDDVAIVRTYHGVKVACYKAPSENAADPTTLGKCPPSPTTY